MSGDDITYSLAPSGPHLTLSNTMLGITLDDARRRHIRDGMWAVIRLSDTLSKAALLPMEGPHPLTHIRVDLLNDELSVRLPSGGSLRWAVPLSEMSDARWFVEEIADRTAARRRHQIDSGRSRWGSSKLPVIAAISAVVGLLRKHG